MYLSLNTAAIGDFGGDAINSAGDVVGDLGESLSSGFDGIGGFDGIAGGLGDAAGGFGDFAGNAAGNIGDFAGNAWENAPSFDGAGEWVSCRGLTSYAKYHELYACSRVHELPEPRYELQIMMPKM